MTQLSRFWNGIALGDALVEAPYDAPTEFAKVLLSIAGADNDTNKGGVWYNDLSELAATNPASTTVRIASGRAQVWGTWYENDGNVDETPAAPAGSTRIDRYVLRKDWAAQTVRIFRIAGVEGAGAPSLVQSVGTTWDYPIVQASTTTGGVVTLTDQRTFIGLTDPLRLGLGSVSAVPYGFLNDPNTGMYSPAADQLAFAAAGAQIWKASAAGEINMPLQPAFLAFNSVTDVDQTGNGATVTVDFDTEVFDQGGDFAADTFTAPIAGRYLLDTQVTFVGLSNAMVQYSHNVITSNATYNTSPQWVSTSSVGAQQVTTLRVLADMDAGDTAYVSVAIAGGAGNTADISGHASTRLTFFSGVLAC